VRALIKGERAVFLGPTERERSQSGCSAVGGCGLMQCVGERHALCSVSGCSLRACVCSGAMQPLPDREALLMPSMLLLSMQRVCKRDGLKAGGGARNHDATSVGVTLMTRSVQEVEADHHPHREGTLLGVPGVLEMPEVLLGDSVGRMPPERGQNL
jgi:hypothetical protein